MLKRILLISAAAASFATGQTPETPVISIYPPPIMRPGESLRAYLNLTDAQSQALQTVLAAKNRAEQAIYEEARQKQIQLDNLMRNSSTDYLLIGRLTVEIRDIYKKLPLSAEPYRSQALAVLSPDQRAKLPALSNALTLMPAANDAVFFSLIDRPQVPDGPIILGLPERTAAPEASKE